MGPDQELAICRALEGDWALANEMEQEALPPDPYVPPEYAGIPGLCRGGFCEVVNYDDLPCFDDEDEVEKIYAPPLTQPPMDENGNRREIGRLIGYRFYLGGAGYPATLQTDLVGEVAHVDEMTLAEYAESVDFAPRNLFS